MGVLARRQYGRVSWAQLVALGLAKGTIAGWIEAGYLRRVLPKVYAVGHDAPSHDADLVAAVLYAGPGAALSHMSAAHHRELIKYAPAEIHVSTPRPKLRSAPGLVTVHANRACIRVAHRGIPTTTTAQTLLDLAAAEPKLLPRALATLDFRKELDPEAIARVCGHGRRGSKALRAALEVHQPQIAYANGELEEQFFGCCVRWQIPLPQLNVRVHGELVDAYWPAQRLVVELDGYANHSSRAQLHRDHSRDLRLRAGGLNVVRYDWRLMRSQPEAVRNDLVKQLAEP